MVDQSIQISERVSALVDGQLSGEEFVQTLAELESDPQARAQWDTYHLVGDVMRTGQVQLRTHDAEFVHRLRQRMLQNAINNIAESQDETKAIAHNLPNPKSANDASWRLVAGLASVALIGVLTWQGLSWPRGSDADAGARVAQQTGPVATQLPPAVRLAEAPATSSGQLLVRKDGTSALVMAPEPQVMIRDPQLDALLAAHRQLGGASALQMPSGFLRNATFEEGGR
jgi:sigma-E factor negative regulatory protein RseA